MLVNKSDELTEYLNKCEKVLSIENLTAIVNKLRSRNEVLSIAESLTGGLIVSNLISVAGTSDVIHEGVVTYSNKSKEDRLNVKYRTLIDYGAVSQQTSREMVCGLLNNSYTTIAVSTTGIAGPTGASADKPLGLTYISVGKLNNIVTNKYIFKGNRNQVRLQACATAIDLLDKYIDENC